MAGAVPRAGGMFVNRREWSFFSAEAGIRAVKMYRSKAMREVSGDLAGILAALPSKSPSAGHRSDRLGRFHSGRPKAGG